jgi:hypothetical protein
MVPWRTLQKRITRPAAHGMRETVGNGAPRRVLEPLYRREDALAWYVA